MVNKELWLKNNTEADVHLSDLGVKVRSLKTINVYAYNPYITDDKVRLSMESGSLYKRLNTETLSVVRKPKSTRPHTLDHIKASDEVVRIVKTKTSVVIDTKEIDVLEDDDLGEIADYGLGDLGHKNTNYIKTEDGSVVVKQRQDKIEKPEPETKVSMQIVKSTNMSGQSIVAMTELAEKAVNPVGPMAESTSPEQSFVVVRPPSSPKTAPPKPAVVGKTKVGKDASGAVVVTGANDGLLEASVSDYDTNTATKDESGSIVMKLKDPVKSKAKSKPKSKAKPVKVTKKAKKTKK